MIAAVSAGRSWPRRPRRAPAGRRPSRRAARSRDVQGPADVDAPYGRSPAGAPGRRRAADHLARGVRRRGRVDLRRRARHHGHRPLFDRLGRARRYRCACPVGPRAPRHARGRRRCAGRRARRRTGRRAASPAASIVYAVVLAEVVLVVDQHERRVRREQRRVTRAAAGVVARVVSSNAPTDGARLGDGSPRRGSTAHRRARRRPRLEGRRRSPQFEHDGARGGAATRSVTRSATTLASSAGAMASLSSASAEENSSASPGGRRGRTSRRSRLRRSRYPRRPRPPGVGGVVAAAVRRGAYAARRAAGPHHGPRGIPWGRACRARATPAGGGAGCAGPRARRGPSGRARRPTPSSAARGPGGPTPTPWTRPHRARVGGRQRRCTGAASIVTGSGRGARLMLSCGPAVAASRSMRPMSSAVIEGLRTQDRPPRTGAG